MIEIERLARDDVIDARSLAAVRTYAWLSQRSQMAAAGEDETLNRIEAQRRMRALDRAVSARVGIVGLGVLRSMCLLEMTAATVAMGLGFARGDRPDLGDARRAHALIRVVFEALVQALINERARPVVEIVDVPVGVSGGVSVDGRRKPKAVR